MTCDLSCELTCGLTCDFTCDLSCDYFLGLYVSPGVRVLHLGLSFARYTWSPAFALRLRGLATSRYRMLVVGPTLIPPLGFTQPFQGPGQTHLLQGPLLHFPLSPLWFSTALSSSLVRCRPLSFAVVPFPRERELLFNALALVSPSYISLKHLSPTGGLCWYGYQVCTRSLNLSPFAPLILHPSLPYLPPYAPQNGVERQG